MIKCKKIVRRSISYILVVVLLLVNLTACGNKQDSVMQQKDNSSISSEIDRKEIEESEDDE